jgi:membrane glycosyltransferase
MSEFIKAQKAIIIGVFAILFLMIALLFRTEISGFLSFVPKIPADIPANTGGNNIADIR